MTPNRPTGLHFLFSAGATPSAGEFVKLTAEGTTFQSNVIAPDTHSSVEDRSPIVELVRSGLTFDLSGFAPSSSSAGCQPKHFIGVDREIIREGCEGLLLNLGPHLQGVHSNLLVVREMLTLSAEIAGVIPKCVAMQWLPSATAISTERFVHNVTRWTDHGEFPVDPLIALQLKSIGGTHSEGLTLFTGQELRIEPEATLDPNSVIQIGKRLLGYLALRGPISKAEEVAGPDGSPIRLEPSNNGKFVRAWRS